MTQPVSVNARRSELSSLLGELFVELGLICRDYEFLPDINIVWIFQHLRIGLVDLGPFMR